MAHVLINAVSAKSGGAATYVMNLVASLAGVQSPHRFTIYAPHALVDSLPVGNMRISAVATAIGSASWRRRILWDQITLRRLIRRNQVDVLVSSSDFGVLLAPCRQLLLMRNGLFFSSLYDAHVLTRHKWKARMSFKLRRSMTLASARSSDAIMVASHSMRDDVRRAGGCNVMRLLVNAFGVPLDRFGPPTDQAVQPQQLFRLLYVSEYGDYKNFTTLYRAMKLLTIKGQKDILLVTTADPWQNPDAVSMCRDDDQALCRDPFVAPFVKNVGYVPYVDVPMLYQHCDTFVFPSLVESFGHPLAEAMASGCPIIASDTPINREICGEAALYFDPFDPAGLAEQVLLLRTNSDVRARLSAAGRRRVEQLFDWQDHVTRFLKCLDEVAVGA